MSIFVFNGVQNNPGYTIDPNAQRPAWAVETKIELIQIFVETKFAKETTLADLLNSNPNITISGVLESLDRRHIVSWDHIKKYICYMANHYSGVIGGAQQSLFNVRSLLEALHVWEAVQSATNVRNNQGYPQAVSFYDKAAIQAFSCMSNLWIGPSGPNRKLGKKLDFGQEDNFSANEVELLLKGTPWKGLADKHNSAKAVIEQ